MGWVDVIIYNRTQTKLLFLTTTSGVLQRKYIRYFLALPIKIEYKFGKIDVAENV